MTGNDFQSSGDGLTDRLPDIVDILLGIMVGSTTGEGLIMTLKVTTAVAGIAWEELSILGLGVMEDLSEGGMLGILIEAG